MIGEIVPAIDQCEPQVIRALEKAGWIVIDQPFAIRIDETDRQNYVFADLRLEQPENGQSIIVAEVKCFARSLFDEFYTAIGQYIVYRNALRLKGINSPLYLALPAAVFSSFFQKTLVQVVLKDVQIKMIVIDLDKEEIVSWIH